MKSDLQFLRIRVWVYDAVLLCKSLHPSKLSSTNCALNSIGQDSAADLKINACLLCSQVSQNPVLKNLAETGKLIAFAEDLFIIAGNKVEAEDALNACHLLKNYGLNINLKKTQIMTDREDMDGVEEISGVKIVEKSDTRNLPLLRQTETPGIC